MGDRRVPRGGVLPNVDVGRQVGNAAGDDLDIMKLERWSIPIRGGISTNRSALTTGVWSDVGMVTGWSNTNVKPRVTALPAKAEQDS
jgi:hypothetical protein